MWAWIVACLSVLSLRWTGTLVQDIPWPLPHDSPHMNLNWISGRKLMVGWMDGLWPMHKQLATTKITKIIVLCSRQNNNYFGLSTSLLSKLFFMQAAILWLEKDYYTTKVKTKGITMCSVFSIWETAELHKKSFSNIQFITIFCINFSH